MSIAHSYGNTLSSTTGIVQPNYTVYQDAYGLIQTQFTFAVDIDRVTSALTYYKNGVDDPFNLGQSYKVHVSGQKGEVAMVTVDYMGIENGSNTEAQITGITNVTMQPIESHPNFSSITETYSGANDYPLAGYPSDMGKTDNPSKANNPIFLSIINNKGVVVGYTFQGFGAQLDSTQPRNLKQGVTHYLRPMSNIRGTIFYTDSDTVSTITSMVGQRGLGSYAETLIPDMSVIGGGANRNKRLLLQSANVEIIGSVNNPAAYKIVYDILYTGDNTDGWDADIYKSVS